MVKYRNKLFAAVSAVVAAGAVAVSGLAVASASPVSGGRVSGAERLAALPKIWVSMNGKKITVSGALQSGGVRIVSRVTRVRQAEPIFIRLDPGVTLGQFFGWLHSRASNDLNSLNGIGSIVLDAQANRGTSSVQADLRAGQYVAADVANNNPAQQPGTTFVIGKAAHPAALPKPGATVAAIEFGFRGAGVLRDGELVRFANHGFLVHMIVFAAARSRADARKIARLLHEGKEGQAQRLAAGEGTFAGPLSHGAFQQLVVRTRPGYIVLACFMQTQDGRDHVLLGMERVIHIVK